MLEGREGVGEVGLEMGVVSFLMDCWFGWIEGGGLTACSVFPGSTISNKDANS